MNCLLFILIVAAASALPRTRLGAGSRTKRTTEHIIRDCMLVTSEPGHYFYKAPGDDPTVCGVYLMTDPDKLIELQFDYLDLPCSSGGLVAFVDGWELNGGYFPSPGEHRLPIEDRVSEFCGMTRPSRAFISSQNAALIQYRVPKRSRGFSFRVNFLKNPTPCNVLVEGLDVWTIRNYGKSTNCSLTTLYPAQISLLSLSVGVSLPGDTFKIETGTMRKCEETGLKDFVEISGGMDLSTPKLIQANTFCGIDSYPGHLVETVLCGIATIRLVSSGEFDNAVTVGISQATEEALNSPALICP
ncbi:unnamed protein product [Nezara viridula]|uniref:Corticotropin-releasing factor-binding protein n=1 Tax=Nezara viridula TaxID=85310 RepID=A0A9P0HLW5_NEZVI|nr:unnamed protein product [Nezara viridula]